MDPITLATVTSAVVALGCEVAKGGASEIGKETWRKLKSLFEWTSDPQPSEFAPQVAKRLQHEPELMDAVLELLKNDDGEVANALINSIKVEQGAVYVISKNEGGIHNDMKFGKK